MTQRTEINALEPLKPGVDQTFKQDGATRLIKKQRKAVPPGYLHDLLQARQRMNSVGLKAGRAAENDAGPKASTASSLLRRTLIPKGKNPVPYVPTNTLPHVFQQRKKFLQKKKQRLRTPYRLRPSEPVGLLSMPEDVLLKIVCYLKHDEIKPLFQICKPLAHTLHEAIRFHFNFATPSRQHAQQAPAPAASLDLPPPEKTKRPGVTNLAAVMAHLRRPKHGVSGINVASGSNTTAPRALTFNSAQNTPQPR